MLKRVMIGAGAGAAATIPQSAVVWGLRHAGVYRRRPAPEVVSEQITSSVVDFENVPERWRGPLKAAQHFGFGAGAGALFGLATGVVRPTIAAGVLTGLVIWKASYDGWIPALGIMPPPRRDEQGRVLTMVLAHIAYGFALGWLMERMTT